MVEAVLRDHSQWNKWANLNRGARMNAGLDIIKTLPQDHYEFRCPVWIDNAGA